MYCLVPPTRWRHKRTRYCWLQLTDGSGSNWNKRTGVYNSLTSSHLRSVWHFGGFVLEETPRGCSVLYCIEPLGKRAVEISLGGKHRWAGSIWDSLRETKAGPFPIASNVVWNGNGLPTKRWVVWKKSDVISCSSLKGWGYITNTIHGMLWRHAVGHRSWALELPAVWKWRTDTDANKTEWSHTETMIRSLFKGGMWIQTTGKFWPRHFRIVEK